jgi:glycosyltransferase involved in cell wall biosynthesis
MIPTKKYPRVTVLVPCFAAGAYVGDAIRCALAQTYSHIEIIVAPDDGDTYIHLRETFKSPQLRIIPPGNSVASGAGATRNRAIDASSGDFIAMLDADDVIAPDYIAKLMQVAMIEGAAVAPTCYVEWDGTTIVREPPIHKGMLSLSGFSQLLSSIHPLIHRSMEPGYRDGFAQDVIHDGTIIAKLSTIAVVPDITYNIRLRVDSACGSGADAELNIQRDYARWVTQILRQPTTLGVHCLSLQDRLDFADLFRFRAMVSLEFSKSGEPSYNHWVAGREAQLWDDFTSSQFDRLTQPA